MSSSEQPAATASGNDPTSHPSEVPKRPLEVASITSKADAGSTAFSYPNADESEDLPPGRLFVSRNLPPKRHSLDSKKLQAQQQLSQHPTKASQTVSSIVTKITSAPSSATSSITSAGYHTRRGRSHSRSRSPSLRSLRDRTADGSSGASFSSFEDIPKDILYDKLGLDGDLKDFKSGGAGSSSNSSLSGSAALASCHHQHSHSYTYGESLGGTATGLTPTRPHSNLTPVSERLSEDTLEDVHAFSDLSCVTRSSVGTRSVGGGSTIFDGDVSSHGVLEPLDEVDEDDNDSITPVNGDSQLDCIAEQVIVTNMENINLQSSSDSGSADDDDMDDVPETAEKE